MRRTTLIFALLAAVSFQAARALDDPPDWPDMTAGDRYERCLEELDSIRRRGSEFDWPHIDAREGAEFARVMYRMQRAVSFLDSSASREEAVWASTMRQFASDLGLSAEVSSLAAAGSREEFWRRAEVELNQRVARLELDFQPLLAEWKETNERCKKLKAAYLAGVTDPLPVRYYPAGHAFAGNPILTDDVITRWMKGAYAAEKSGGGWWRAAGMTLQEFESVKSRINSFLYFSSSEAELKGHFSPEELTVLKAREKDIRNAWTGNWSEVERM